MCRPALPPDVRQEVSVPRSKPLILVVEDEVDLAALVEVNLQLAGYDVVIAADGEAGIASVAAHHPDLVLLDVMLPGIDGWGVLRTVKADGASLDLPVVMLTALSEERDLIRGTLQGAIEYVTKPFEMRRLLTAIEEALAEPSQQQLAERRQRTRTMLQRLAELDSGRSSDTTIRLTGLERLPTPKRATTPQASTSEVDGLATLTSKQRWLAAALAADWSARQISEHLQVSRSNVYATRRRVARRLGCEAEAVDKVGKRLGLGPEAGMPPT
jgi:DNA-binding response OmpR family regulator